MKVVKHPQCVIWTLVVEHLTVGRAFFADTPHSRQGQRESIMFSDETRRRDDGLSRGHAGDSGSRHMLYIVVQSIKLLLQY